jgi:hypothetical protein
MEGIYETNDNFPFNKLILLKPVQTGGNYFIKLNHEDSNTVNFICGTTKELNFDNFEFAIEFSK